MSVNCGFTERLCMMDRYEISFFFVVCALCCCLFAAGK